MSLRADEVALVTEAWSLMAADGHAGGHHPLTPLLAHTCVKGAAGYALERCRRLRAVPAPVSPSCVGGRPAHHQGESTASPLLRPGTHHADVPLRAHLLRHCRAVSALISTKKAAGGGAQPPLLPDPPASVIGGARAVEEAARWRLFAGIIDVLDRLGILQSLQDGIDASEAGKQGSDDHSGGGTSSWGCDNMSTSSHDTSTSAGAGTGFDACSLGPDATAPGGAALSLHSRMGPDGVVPLLEALWDYLYVSTASGALLSGSSHSQTPRVTTRRGSAVAVSPPAAQPLVPQPTPPRGGGTTMELSSDCAMWITTQLESKPPLSVVLDVVARIKARQQQRHFRTGATDAHTVKARAGQRPRAGTHVFEAPSSEETFANKVQSFQRMQVAASVIKTAIGLLSSSPPHLSEDTAHGMSMTALDFDDDAEGLDSDDLQGVLQVSLSLLEARMRRERATSRALARKLRRSQSSMAAQRAWDSDTGLGSESGAESEVGPSHMPATGTKPPAEVSRAAFPNDDVAAAVADTIDEIWEQDAGAELRNTPLDMFSEPDYFGQSVLQPTHSPSRERLQIEHTSEEKHLFGFGIVASESFSFDMAKDLATPEPGTALALRRRHRLYAHDYAYAAHVSRVKRSASFASTVSDGTGFGSSVHDGEADITGKQIRKEARRLCGSATPLERLSVRFGRNKRLAADASGPMQQHLHRLVDQAHRVSEQQRQTALAAEDAAECRRFAVLQREANVLSRLRAPFEATSNAKVAPMCSCDCGSGTRAAPIEIENTGSSGNARKSRSEAATAFFAALSLACARSRTVHDLQQSMGPEMRRAAPDGAPRVVAKARPVPGQEGMAGPSTGASSGQYHLLSDQWHARRKENIAALIEHRRRLRMHQRPQHKEEWQRHSSHPDGKPFGSWKACDAAIEAAQEDLVPADAPTRAVHTSRQQGRYADRARAELFRSVLCEGLARRSGRRLQLPSAPAESPSLFYHIMRCAELRIARDGKPDSRFREWDPNRSGSEDTHSLASSPAHRRQSANGKRRQSCAMPKMHPPFPRCIDEQFSDVLASLSSSSFSSSNEDHDGRSASGTSDGGASAASLREAECTLSSSVLKPSTFTRLPMGNGPDADCPGSPAAVTEAQRLRVAQLKQGTAANVGGMFAPVQSPSPFAVISGAERAASVLPQQSGRGDDAGSVQGQAASAVLPLEEAVLGHLSSLATYLSRPATGPEAVDALLKPYIEKQLHAAMLQDERMLHDHEAFVARTRRLVAPTAASAARVADSDITRQSTPRGASSVAAHKTPFVVKHRDAHKSGPVRHRAPRAAAPPQVVTAVHPPPSESNSPLPSAQPSPATMPLNGLHTNDSLAGTKRVSVAVPAASPRPSSPRGGAAPPAAVILSRADGAARPLSEITTNDGGVFVHDTLVSKKWRHRHRKLSTAHTRTLFTVRPPQLRRVPTAGAAEMLTVAAVLEQSQREGKPPPSTAHLTLLERHIQHCRGEVPETCDTESSATDDDRQSPPSAPIGATPHPSPSADMPNLKRKSLPTATATRTMMPDHVRLRMEQWSLARGAVHAHCAPAACDQRTEPVRVPAPQRPLSARPVTSSARPRPQSAFVRVPAHSRLSGSEPASTAAARGGETGAAPLPIRPASASTRPNTSAKERRLCEKLRCTDEEAKAVCQYYLGVV